MMRRAGTVEGVRAWCLVTWFSIYLVGVCVVSDVAVLSASLSCGCIWFAPDIQRRA